MYENGQDKLYKPADMELRNNGYGKINLFYRFRKYKNFFNELAFRHPSDSNRNFDNNIRIQFLYEDVNQLNAKFNAKQ